ncbi:AlbA family DNA-binding domain-containing protein [Protofrankia symbiont of Coriaria ruscifolia]|uniref:AlbA family DNA-binding domain-containing protein n=1 Tax=Protofrankia symbiont of Coriaria ruscifolia TaxID=1306542 RepID=UPI00104164CD|nr:hypothetical protein [Protofrankia symbiont of Coriaria ruscifolia]
MTHIFRIETVAERGNAHDIILTSENGEKFFATRIERSTVEWTIDCKPTLLHDFSVQDFLVFVLSRGDKLMTGNPDCQIREERHRGNPYLTITIASETENSSGSRWPFCLVYLHECGHIEFACLLLRREGDESSELMRADSVEALERIRAKSVCASAESDGGEYFWDIGAMLDSPHIRLANVWEAAEVLDLVAQLPRDRRKIGRSAVVRVVESGYPEALVGVAENEWLDAKSEIYDFNSDRGKIEFAKDVAQFANSPSGGVLALGYRTRKRGGLDVIHKMTPFPNLPANLVQRMHDHLAARLYPPVSGLTVHQVSAGSGDILLIDIPPQADESKPFIVEGAPIEGKGMGSSFMIPLRSYAGIRPVSGRELHALIAGRVFRSQKSVE